MKKFFTALNIVLISTLVIATIFLTVRQIDGAWLVVFAIAIALLFTNLDKFEEFNIFSMRAILHKTQQEIRAISDTLPSWKVLFEHDEDGNRIDGSIERLIDAAHKGYPVKVRILRSGSHFEVMDAQWLFVDEDLVHASNTSQVSLGPDASGNYHIPPKAWYYFVVVSTRGYHHASRVFLGGEEYKPTDSTRHMTWIGLVPPSEGKT